MMHHHAAGPVSFMGCVHSAAATENFYCLEHHSVDNEVWENLVTGIDKPLDEWFLKFLLDAVDLTTK